MKIIFFILFPLFSFSQQALFFQQNQNGAFVLQKPICSFSIRQLDTAYHGYCMKVRRSSDSTEQDIGFVSGNLDTASLKAFVGSGSGYVSIWYDQSSFGNNAAQTTLSRQPEIVNTGVVDRENTKPALVFNGTSTYLTVANNPLNGSGSVSFLGVANFSTATSTEVLFAQSNSLSNTGVFEIRRSGTGNILACISNNMPATGNKAINAQKLITVYGSNNSTLYSYVNGATNFGIKTTGSSTIGNYPCLIGYRNSTLYFGGTIQEIVVYKENNLMGRSSLESAINSYYSIY